MLSIPDHRKNDFSVVLPLFATASEISKINAIRIMLYNIGQRGKEREASRYRSRKDKQALSILLSMLF